MFRKMKIHLYSIQEEKRLKELEKNGCLVASSNDYSPEHEEAYKWMTNQMKIRLRQPQGEELHPIWSWYQFYDAKKRKPDLRKTSHLPPGTKGIRIEFSKKRDEVLLSDFILWHFPLSYKDYIGKNEKDAIRFAKKLKKYNLENESFQGLPTNLKNEIKESWSKIFDMKFEDKYFTNRFEEKMIQACCWRINIDEVIKIDKFIAR